MLKECGAVEKLKRVCNMFGPITVMTKDMAELELATVCV